MGEGEEEEEGGLRHQRKSEEFKKMGFETEINYRRKRLRKWCLGVVMTF